MWRYLKNRSKIKNYPLGDAKAVGVAKRAMNHLGSYSRCTPVWNRGPSRLPFDLLIYFIISLRLALLGSTTKPRKARVVRASPLGDSIEVDRCTSDVRFHPRYRKLLALLLPVVDRLHRVVSFPPPT